MLKVLFPWKQNNTKKVLSAMEHVVNEEGPSSTTDPPAEEVPAEDLPLLPCHVCNRTFLPRPLKKHIPICEQMARKKRKPFDSLKQRVEGTDMATFFQKSYLKKSNPEGSSQALAGDVYGNNKQSKWREKHFELQNTIKNAKGTKSDMSTSHTVSTSITPNRKTSQTTNQGAANERCPVCDRSFGPKAFDRHVEFCKEQRNRVQVHKSPAVVQQAKERLEARINYRVPPLRQSKRSIIRDKYSPTSQTSLLQRSNSIVSGKSTSSISSTATAMLPNRRQISNNNEKNNERNIRKDAASRTRLDRVIGDCGDAKELIKNDSNKNTVADATPSANYDPFEKAHLQLLQLAEDDSDIVASSSALTTPTIDFRPFVTNSSTPKKFPESAGDKRASVIDPPYHFQDNRASRDLDKEFELLESLVNNNVDQDRGEPTNGFSDDPFFIDPGLINAQDNLFIPERLSSDEHSPNERPRGSKRVGRPTKLAIRPATRPLPMIRRDQVRPAPDGSSAESPSSEVRRASPRSYQATRPKTKSRTDSSPEKAKEKGGRRFGTTVLGRQAGMEAVKAAAEDQEEYEGFSKEKTFTIHRTPTAEELYPDNPLMYEEFRKYEEMYRREKEGKSTSSKKQKKKAADFGVNIEDFSKTYGDSAYGSLNRKQEVEENGVQDRVEKLVLAAPATTTTSPVERLSKFCHECGNRYPVASAKFCVECGVKRLVL